MKKIVRFKAFLVFLFFVSSLYGGEERDFAWLKLQSGVNHFYNHEYGDAMVLFQECKRLIGSYPEADYWIGRIYEVEGDFVLAQQQYNRVLSIYNLKGSYYADQLYETMLHLSDIYLKQEREEDFISILDQLLDLDKSRTKEEREDFYNSVAISLSRDGFDKVLELYRINESYQIEVYTRKANYYLSKKEYEKAKVNLVLATLASLTSIVNEKHNDDTDFIFTTELNAEQKEVNNIIIDELSNAVFSDISSLINNVARESRVRDFIEKTELIENIYSLSDTLYKLGDKNLAIDILWICIKYTYSYEWQKKANTLFMQITSID